MASAQIKNVEDIFKEDTTGQVIWSHNPNRVDRCFAISLETAWNGLAGIGPVLHYYPISHWISGQEKQEPDSKQG